MSLEEKERECSLSLSLSLFFVWAQLGSNQRPPDYESGAANHLSYGPEKVFQSAGSFALCGQRPSRSASRRIRDAANHLSYGPEITGCKYNIKLNYLQTLYNALTPTGYSKVFYCHIRNALTPAGYRCQHYCRPFCLAARGNDSQGHFLSLAPLLPTACLYSQTALPPLHQDHNQR